MRDKIYNVITFLLFYLSLFLPCTFVMVLLRGLLDIMSVLVTLGAVFVELLFIGCLYLFKDKS